jgi:cell division protein FtsW (lipid II flippase)
VRGKDKGLRLEGGSTLSVRNRELANLALVGLLTAAGFASVYIARADVVSAASLSYAAFFMALFVIAHAVLRLRLPHADPFLLPLGGLLAALGITMIYRIDPELAFRQGLWVVVGVGVFAALVLFLKDYRALDNVKYLLGISAIVLLILPALPYLGLTVNGATLWVNLGPLTFQPGELAKVFLVVFLAGYLRDNREMLSFGAAGQGRLPSPKHLGPLLLIWGGAMLVLFQTRDLGGALLYFAIFLVMLYTATARWSFVAAGLGLFLAGAYALYHVIPHVQGRVESWLDPWADPEDASYQLVQSLYAISSGGVFGTGLGNGVLLSPQGNPYIPYLETDFIFSAIAQELGLAGAAGVILLYLIFAYRGFRISMLASDGFSKLLAAGLTAAVSIQAFIIIGGVVGLIPLTGITLPFVSYGGSSIVANFVVLALLLMVSDRVNRGEGA